MSDDDISLYILRVVYTQLLYRLYSIFFTNIIYIIHIAMYAAIETTDKYVLTYLSHHVITLSIFIEFTFLFGGGILVLLVFRDQIVHV